MIEVKETTSINDEIKRESQLLLESPENAEAFRIMNLMSPQNSKSDLLRKAEEIKMKDEIQTSLYSKYKNTKLFKEKDIIKECLKFNMFFDRSQQFRGTFSLELIKKINAFLQENNLIVSEDQYRTNIYLLGYMEFSSKEGGSGAHFKKTQKDPLVFFKITEKGEDFYILIDGNTKYKSLLNRFKGYFYFDENNSRLVYMFLALAIILGISYFFRLGTPHFTLWKWLIILPCLGLGSLLNNLIYYYDGDNQKDNVLYKTNKKYFGRTYNFIKSEYKGLKESLFVFTLFFVSLFVIDRVVLNLKLVHQGSFTTIQEKERTLTEKEIKEKGFAFTPDKDIVQKSTNYVIYTPGVLFYNKTIEEKHSDFIVK